MDLKKHSSGLGKKPALIVVDMINAFTDPECDLGSECESVVKANQELLAEFRKLNLPILFTTVAYHNGEQARVFRERISALNILVAKSHWVDLDERMERKKNEKIVEKQWASGFFSTDLHDLLQADAVDSIVVTGLTTSGCVRATAVDGLQHDYRVVVAEQAVGDRNQQAHDANLFDLNAKYADVESNHTIIEMLSACRIN